MGELTGMAGLKDLQARLLMKAETADGKPLNFECALCQDLQWIGQPAQPCECQARKRQARMFAALKRELGEMYAAHSLESLTPMIARHWKQAMVIDRMRQQPDASWAFFGEKGIGKTLFAFVLARHAIESGRFTVAVSLHSLLDQLRRWQFDEEVKPVITADTLRDAKTSWCVVLDDIGAVTPSAFAGQELLSIVNAIYANGQHQLITTCMSTEANLMRHYEKAGDGLGVAILRRILDAPNVLKPTQLFEIKAPQKAKAA